MNSYKSLILGVSLTGLLACDSRNESDTGQKFQPYRFAQISPTDPLAGEELKCRVLEETVMVGSQGVLIYFHVPSGESYDFNWVINNESIQNDTSTQSILSGEHVLSGLEITCTATGPVGDTGYTQQLLENSVYID
jgi:hypothetical protein